MDRSKPGARDIAETDLDQLSRNLSLSPTERVEKMASIYNDLSEVRGLAVREGRRAAILRAVDAVANRGLRSR